MAVDPQSLAPDDSKPHEVVVIGGGPAGLSAAYELTKRGFRPLVIEKGRIVGGLARTETYKGFRFDMGGHRFFTKSPAVNAMWQEVLGPEFLKRPRLSRIYYKKQFYYYPLRPLNALRQLGIFEGMLIVFSYLYAQLFPHRPENTFEEWVTNRFGKRLFNTFFKSYTEKVWGISCSELNAAWAAQRIKDLSLRSLLLSMFLKPGKSIKTLIEEFDYPRLGPGMMWGEVARQIRNAGGSVHLNSDVVAVRRDGNRITEVDVQRAGQNERLTADHFISSMPITELVRKIDPPPPEPILAAARQLRYRDFITVCLIVQQSDLFQDNWIYVHDHTVRVGRIQNFKNWSPDMVPVPGMTSLGLEYFCNEGDDLWSMSDADLIELGKRELEAIGLARMADVTDGCVFRVPKSYPVYEGEYAAHIQTLRSYIDGLANLQTIGRNGLHRYDNQDHAMLTGMLAARNICHSEANDLWSVNTDKEYHEEVRS
jgi:protoporphyrinogen oxidase